MKKFKLIKEYPGSPVLGTETQYFVNFVGEQNPRQYKIDSCSFINANYIENNPEFWKEIVSLNYQILSFKLPVQGNVLVCLNDKGKYGASGLVDYSLEQELNLVRTGNRTIHSIKRLSDGEVFTVGDAIDGAVSTNKIIQTFIIAGKSILIKPTDSSGVIDLRSAEKVKQKLFTTEDGVDLFEGETVFSITNFNITKNIASSKYPNSHPNHPVEHWYKGDIYFSTKDEAEKYIIWNKPCLSLRDIANNLTSGNLLIIKKLVKEKLEKR